MGDYGIQKLFAPHIGKHGRCVVKCVCRFVVAKIYHQYKRHSTFIASNFVLAPGTVALQQFQVFSLCRRIDFFHVCMALTPSDILIAGHLPPFSTLCQSSVAPQSLPPLICKKNRRIFNRHEIKTFCASPNKVKCAER